MNNPSFTMFSFVRLDLSQEVPIFFDELLNWIEIILGGFGAILLRLVGVKQ